MVTEPLLETRLALSCLEGFRTQSLPTKSSRLLQKKKKRLEPSKKIEDRTGTKLVSLFASKHGQLGGIHISQFRGS